MSRLIERNSAFRGWSRENRQVSVDLALAQNLVSERLSFVCLDVTSGKGG